VVSNPKGMVVKVLLAYGPDCDWSMAWLAGSRLAVSSVRKVWCDAKADRCKQLLLPVAPHGCPRRTRKVHCACDFMMTRRLADHVCSTSAPADLQYARAKHVVRLLALHGPLGCSNMLMCACPCFSAWNRVSVREHEVNYLVRPMEQKQSPC